MFLAVRSKSLQRLEDALTQVEQSGGDVLAHVQELTVAEREAARSLGVDWRRFTWVRDQVGRLLTTQQAAEMLKQLKGWIIEDGKLVKVYPFGNYYQTMAFVNALAWVSHREDHHPDLTLGYNRCRVEYSTHAIGGLSENDFICAAKCDALFGL